MPTRAPHQSKVTVLQTASFKALSWLAHGFSTRPGGFSRAYGKSDLNLGFTNDDSRSTVERNRAAFLRELQSSVSRPGARARPSPHKSASLALITLRQIHSDIIHRVDAVPPEQLVGDGLITDVPGLLLAIQTADCLPLMLVDPKRRAVGVFHAGWRGTVQRIAEKGVGAMVQAFGSRARAPGHTELPKKIFLDLVEANRRQLLAAGVLKKNIDASKMCTNCHPDLLFSYRAERGKTGRMMAVAGIRR